MVKQDLVVELAQQLKTKYTSASENYWLRGAIQSVPTVGSAIDTWAFQFAEKAKQERIEEALRVLSNRLEKLEKEIDAAHVIHNIEQYVYLFEIYLRQVSVDYREEMRAYLSEAMAHLFTKKYSEDDNKEIYLNKLSSLNPSHIAILTEAYNFTFNDGKQDYEKTKTLSRYLREIFQSRGLSEAVTHGLIKDLESQGLLSNSYTATFGGGITTMSVTPLGTVIVEMLYLNSDATTK